MKLSPHDAYALRLGLAGKTPPPDLELSPLVASILRFAGDNTGQLLALLGDELAQTLFATVDPTQAPKTQEDGLDIPPLPAACRLSQAHQEAALGAGQWLDQFTEWASNRSPMTPPLFLEAGGLWALGLLVAGRAECPLWFARVSPHLYVMWVAITSYYNKSTGLACVNDLVWQVAPHLLLSSANTPEVLFYKLAGNLAKNYEVLPEREKQLEKEGAKFAGQRGILVDEASRLFLAKKYLEGLTEDFLELYDGKARMSSEKMGEGKLVIEHPRFSILGATTPAKFGKVGEESWGDGLMARFALLCPPSSTMPYVDSGDLFDDQIPPALAATALRLYSRLPVKEGPNEARKLQTIQISPEAIKALKAYHKGLRDLTPEIDERLHGNYGRFHVQAVKIASLLALTDWGDQDAPKIELAHFHRAQLITETWRESAHRLLVTTSQSREVQAQNAILGLLERRHKALSRSDILRATGISDTRTLDSALAMLLEAGKVDEISKPSGPQGGRPAIAYQIAKGD
jgi:hypothetical protein